MKPQTKSLSEQLEILKRRLDGRDTWDEETKTFKPTNANQEKTERLLMRYAKLYNEQVVIMLKERAARRGEENSEEVSEEVSS